MMNMAPLGIWTMGDSLGIDVKEKQLYIVYEYDTSFFYHLLLFSIRGLKKAQNGNLYWKCKNKIWKVEFSLNQG